MENDKIYGDQLTLFDEPTAPAPQKITRVEVDSPELSRAIDGLKAYALGSILFYDIGIREAFRGGKRAEFTELVKDALSDAMNKFHTGELTSEYAENADFAALYAEMYENGEFAKSFYEEISELLSAEHEKISKAREAAHSAGLAYDEYPYDAEENFDPYAYDPDRMRDEDYDRIHAAMSAERTEAEKLIGAYIRIDDVDYRVEEIVPDGSTGLLAVLRAGDKEITERVEDVREKPERREKTFSEQVDELLNGTFEPYSALKVCDTPKIFIDVGCRQLPMLYTQQHFRDAIKPKSDKNSHTHGLTVEQIKAIPSQIAEPAILLDSISPGKNGNNSIIAVLNAFDNDNAPIIVSVVPNGSGQYQLETVDSNFITSIYGKERGFFSLIERAIQQDKILFWDKKKSQELFKFQGLQLPEAFNNLDSNIIIHQSRNIVNPFSEKISENSQDSLNRESVEKKPPEASTDKTGKKPSICAQIRKIKAEQKEAERTAPKRERKPPGQEL